MISKREGDVLIDCIPLLETVCDDHPQPLLFATVSGAHLYGFPSPDSDFDLRGVHCATIDELHGLDRFDETLDNTFFKEAREIDLVTHDAKKFFLMMLRRNGYVLEQLFSPLVIRSSPWHEELIALGKDCITSHHVHHYLGFGRNQWRLFGKENPPRIKPLLYTYRVLLTGIHLMRSGILNANLIELNEEFKLPFVPDLIEAKIHGKEKQTLPEVDMSFHETEVHRLLDLLEQAGENSQLPNEPSSRGGLNDLLLRIRKSF